MTKKIEIVLGLLLLTIPLILLWHAKKPPQVIIYKVDNAGTTMVGKITHKEIIDGRYTVTAGAYGKFLVTEEQYNQIQIGDDIPEYLAKRGS